ncbi:MAG TPA: hypothetical protein VH141_32710 [Pseudonocardia sp.]|jgi:hypothetical protein|nr:hypothetical protein [Pseudonocardia sp.]
MNRDPGHFPGHLREAFIAWLWAGFPEKADIEENYVAKRLTADDFLRGFIEPHCSDCLPKDERDWVRAHLGLEHDDFGMSYGNAATALLVARIAGAATGAEFLRRLVFDYE